MPTTETARDLATASPAEPAPAVARPSYARRGPAIGTDESAWIGTDESGKGDYFGPLVTAGVYADEQIAERLAAIGVADCKRLSDTRVRALAPQVRAAVGAGRYNVTRLVPRRYNDLYGRVRSAGRNLNWLLAWEHVRCIEDLLESGLRPRYAVVDQFAGARLLERRLMAQARRSGLEVLQFPRAESDVAVAAASILAREAFIAWLEHASIRVGFDLPRGCSRRAQEAANRIGTAGGRGALREVAKLHFKTTQKALAPAVVSGRR